jgi:hypothetical protein
MIMIDLICETDQVFPVHFSNSVEEQMSHDKGKDEEDDYSSMMMMIV